LCITRWQHDVILSPQSICAFNGINTPLRILFSEPILLFYTYFSFQQFLYFLPIFLILCSKIIYVFEHFYINIFCGVWSTQVCVAAPLEYFHTMVTALSEYLIQNIQAVKWVWSWRRNVEKPITWIVIIKNFAINLPSQPIIGHHLGFHIFFTMAFFTIFTVGLFWIRFHLIAYCVTSKLPSSNTLYILNNCHQWKEKKGR